MQSSYTLIKISGDTLEVKKIDLIKDSQNIFAYWNKSEQSQGLADKLKGLGGSTTPANKIVI